METKDMHRHNPFIAFIVVALIVTVSLDGQSIQFGGPDLEFIEYEYNPVLDGKSSWAYLAVSGPDVMFDNGIYKMWFNGVSDMGQEIGYATSTDGLNWEIYPEPVLSHLDSASANETLVKWPEVIKVGNQYWMYYTACDTLGIFQLYLATSDDGISWARYSPETILGIGPSGSFDAEYVGYARIIQWNGQYAMWYSGAESIAEARFQVGFATSPDGLTWTKYSSNPVMDYFIDDGEEYYHICAGSPIVHADNSLEMFYTGRISNPPSQINHAWSTDGINWTPSPANPLITHGGPGSWNEGNTSQPAVLLQDGRYKIWYGGYSSAGWRTWAIGYGAATPVGSRTLYATDTRWVAGDTINVEIKLSQTAGVAGIDFTVTYDSLLLHFAGIDKASATNDFLLVENSLPGTLAVAMASADAMLDAWDIPVANLSFVISPTAAIGTSSPVLFLQAALADTLGSPLEVFTVSGQITVTMPGDVNLDGRLSSGDAVIALRMSLGYSFVLYTPQAFAMADRDSNGVIEETDALCILQSAVGLDCAMTPGESGQTAQIILPYITGSVGAEVEVPISLALAQELAAGSIELALPQERFTLLDIVPGDFLENGQIAWQMASPYVKIGFIQPEGSMKEDQGELARLRLRLNAPATGESFEFISYRLFTEIGQSMGAAIMLSSSTGTDISPATFVLHPNYPNPFNPSTTIRYDTPEAGMVTLIVYDIIGREVTRLIDEPREPGFHSAVWYGRDANGRQVPTGIYIARLTAPDYTKSIKMLLLK